MDVEKMMRSTLVLIAILALGAAGCGDDGLGKTFQKGDSDGGPDDLGPPSPIPLGGIAYNFSHSYRPSATPCAGGLVCGERQSSGFLCVKVNSLRDTATEMYKDEPETIVNAQIKVVGSAADPDIIISEQDNPPGDPMVVDGSIAPLWLKASLFPSRGHPYGSPTPVNFETRDSPAPPTQVLARLPFFDVRDSRDLVWGGWDRFYDMCPDFPGSMCPEHLNYLNDMYDYFLTDPPFGVSYFTMELNKRPISSPTLYSLELAWREAALVGGPSTLTGRPVVRSLRLEYDENGVLQSGFEFLKEETPVGTGQVAFFNQCPDAPCLTAVVLRSSQPFSGQPCTF